MGQMRRPTTSLMALAAVVTLAGCGDGGGDAGGGTALSSSAESRRPMPSCGAYTAPPDGLPAEGWAARDCFLAAFAEGREAELTITAPSIEGDPIVTIYRVLGPDDVELFVDASADKFAAVDAYHQRCTSVAEEGNALAAGGCTTVG
jgi:hypothetical protein